MKNRTARFWLCSAVGLALATLGGMGRALAQDPPAAEGTTPPPADGTPPADGAAAAPARAGRPDVNTDVTLKQGGIYVDADVVMNLSSNQAFKPVQIVPNLYYGVSDALTVGVAHNSVAEIFQVGGGIPGAPRGLCITGESNGCSNFYNNASLDALFSFMRSSVMDLAAHGGLDFMRFDPFRMSLRAGVKGKMLAGPVVIVFDPSLNIGLNDRSAGNKELLALPVRAGYLVMPQLDLGVSAGLYGSLDGFGDTYSIPVGLGGVYALNKELAVRAQFTVFDISGNVTSGAFDGRGLSVGAVYRM
jgi:hypothetical protein